MIREPLIGSRPHLVIYHARCADGAVAAWAARRALGPTCEFVPWQHGDDPPDIELVAYRAVFVLDFSFERSVLDEIDESADSLEVIDHHLSAVERLEGAPYARLDTTKSGAELAWARFHPGIAAPNLVRYVGDRDLWQWALPSSRELNAAIGLRMRALRFDPQRLDSLHEALEDRARFDVLVSMGEMLLEQQLELARGQARRAAMRVLDGVEVWVANCTTLISETGAEIVAQQAAPALLWSEDTSTGEVLCSLRSRDDLADVGAVAMHLGGGGHRNAAGFKLASRAALKEILVDSPF